MAAESTNGKRKESKADKPQGKGYPAECTVLGALALVYSVALIRAVSPLFFLCLVFPAVICALLVKKRAVASGLCTFFAAGSFCMGIPNMKTMWENKYVFLPGLILLAFNAGLIFLFRNLSPDKDRGRNLKILLICASVSLAVVFLELLKYRVPENVFAYFSENPPGISSFIRRTVISSQASLGFLLPGAVIAFLLFLTVTKDRAEKSAFLISAAVVAFAGGFLGFFGYKDMASPVLLLSVSCAFCLSELSGKTGLSAAYFAEGYFVVTCFYELLRRVME